MFREKEICDAIRTAYLHLFPDKKERKRALSRLDLELVAQGIRYRGESVLAYQTSGSHACAPGLLRAGAVSPAGMLHLPKNGPKSFHAGGCRLYPGTVVSGGWTVCGGVRRDYKIPFGIRAVFYLLPHGTPYRQGRDWQDYPPEEIADAFEDINDHPFDGMPGVFYEV